jgi:hypothetical protein
VEEGALLEADVDEGRLDAGEHGFHAAEIDVADGAAMVGTIDEQLDELVVLEDGNARLALAAVDEDLALQAGQPWPHRAAPAQAHGGIGTA